ncbi:hypothetical protein [Phycicoccus duodecadis]|uniref:Lipoprotein n=1 Tax=Phycicoccus duodecadis TaxID=173053 RepID=A0A2N3YGQ8_9MICO|nr:hypothetical protein [Phycicoccus duodecadis]PKW26010.1 hypothetical protein ATL31_0814 [Phycicoccus duodecadis]
MSRPTPRHTARRTVVAAVAGALALATAGCGATDALVGLHPAPAEASAAAPLDAEGATGIAARLLAAERAVAGVPGAKGDTARAAVLRGDALLLANAVAARGQAVATTAELSKAPEPTVLAQSRGRGWPRAILATTLDPTTSTQVLHVMVSLTPTDPFRIASSVGMFGGAELPALGSEQAGAPFVEASDGTGLVLSPEKALAAYAAALARPAPSKPPASVSVDDAFGAALAASAARQSKALGTLASLRQRHVAIPKGTVAFRLADGGVVAFGLLQRTDTIAVRAGAKELVLPRRYAELVGKTKVTTSVSLKSLEPVVLIVPTEGDVTAIGASEILVSGTGR